MIDLDSLKKLVRENGYLYTKDVTNAGIRREYLKKYLEEGRFGKVGESIPLLTVSMMNLYCCRADVKKAFSLMEQYCIFMACQIGFHR